VPARLYHERIARSDVEPARWLALTHGIYGAGSNWRSIARKLNERRPEWGVVLVDLRQHGRSEPGEPPHTIAACADDLRALCGELGGVEAIAGHSFGGKVALALLVDAAPELREMWVLDSSPGPRPERAENDVTRRVLAALRALPAQLESRSQFIAALEQRGIPAAIARWLAKNVVREGELLHFALDLDAIEQMIADYDRIDLWPAVERALPHVTLRFVLAGHDSAVPLADRRKLEALNADGAIDLHVLPGAGHWLHVDDPEGLLALMTRDLRG
jgi:esterase